MLTTYIVHGDGSGIDIQHLYWKSNRLRLDETPTDNPQQWHNQTFSMEKFLDSRDEIGSMISDMKGIL